MMLNPSLPAIADLEDDALPQNLPPVIDAHVHLFHENAMDLFKIHLDPAPNLG